MSDRPRIRPIFAVCLLILFAGLAWFGAQHSYSLYDDAYIYFRYVENLAHGCGLRWNCGETPVEGFTSPLYFLLLATARLFTSNLETASQILGVFSLGLALGLTLGAALDPRLAPGSPALAAVTAIVISVSFALEHVLLLNAVSGLETSLGCLAVALIFTAALSDRPPIALSVAAVLVRPELGVFLPALLVWPQARKLRPLALMGGALLAMTLVRWLEFHDFLPNTFWAKTGGSPAHLSLGLRYCLDTVRDFPLIIMAPLALWKGPRAVRFFLAATAPAFAFFLYSGGDTFRYSRLAVPFVPTLTLLALVGLARVLQKWRIPALALPAALTLCTLLWAERLPAQHGFDNVLRWALVGKWLRAHHPDTRLATVPIGAIGYFSGAPLLDLVGLTQREVARGERVPDERLTRSWIGHEKHNTEWVLQQKPTLLVFTKWRDRPWTIADARAGFWAEWQLLSAVKSGRAPYTIEPAEIAPGVHWLIFRYNEGDAMPGVRQ